MTDLRAGIDIDEVLARGSLVDISGDQARITLPSDAIELLGRQTSFYEKFAKPLMDTLGAGLLLVLCAPVMFVVAMAIRVTMGGPIILKQHRTGRYGRVFTLYKFRTMEADRRAEQVPFVGTDRRQTHKDPGDPRITPVGRFLRKWSLDELPQFFNVLKGDMSLVGPRPEMIQIVANYEPWQHLRHAVKPGITGPWQISERGDKMLHECTESDIGYVQSLSLWADLSILLLTPLAALGVRRGE